MILQAWLAKKGAQLWALLAAIGAAVAVVFGFYAAAKRAGVAVEREKRAEDEVKRVDAEAVRKVEQAQEVAAVAIDKVGNANEVVNDVVKLDTGAAADKLRDEWARD